MNKKFLSILLCIALSSLVVGCGNSAKTSETNTNVAEETNKDQIKLNEPFEVKTESGDYKFTITGASKTDWWNRAYMYHLRIKNIMGLLFKELSI